MNGDLLAETEWSDVPADPDPGEHLGYSLTDWELVTTASDGDQVVFLPEDEEMLRDEAFVLAARDVLCSLDDHR